uniref:Uncharacterized protein n=1 Tax=Siphoviridae sp. ctckI12 TaxID=2825574 RepID=A0A8S5NXK7_9CAUD|nr:MAG TPA: hypothetical protein [Siphoviridae sp. ctckI12]DAG68083.1 MAG TPA: hypothetical protein [Caudoviricetes sp.]
MGAAAFVAALFLFCPKDGTMLALYWPTLCRLFLYN